MKKFFVLPLLAIATMVTAQTAGNPGSAAAPAATPAQEKTIKDPAEFAAYNNAISITDPAKKGDALLQFVLQYPNTIVKEDVLGDAMIAYQQAGDMAKVQSAATQLLQVNPNNLRGLVLLTYAKLQAGKQFYGAGQQAAAAGPLGEAAQYGQKGLQAAQAAANDPDTQKLKAAVVPIFNEAIGMNALNAKSYADAQKYLRAAVEALNTSAPLELVYELTSAYLQPTPPDAINGSWFGARAVNLAQPAQQQGIKNYVLFYYKKYHGGPDGFDDILNQTKAAALPPASFTITPAPPPPTTQEVAQKIMATTKIPDMAFEDWLYVLGSGYQAGADQVWDYLKGKRIDIQGNVISATPTELVVAVLDDDKTMKKGDITLKLQKPLLASKVPAPGAVVDYDATFSAYTTNPLMVVMDDATVHGAPHPAATPHRGTTKKGTTHKRTH